MERRCFPFSLAGLPLFLILTACQLQNFVPGFAVGEHPSHGVHRRVPALFVFGDSTVDPGNNNYWLTPLKGNFPPYGLSFPGHIATGRFCDGRLATDFMASYLGIKELVPPYLDPKLDEQELLSGVSFAFAGSGYDPMTAHNIGVVSVLQQLDYMREYLVRMEKLVGKARAAKIMEDSIFTVSAGTNDFVITYYLLPFRKQTFTPEEYQQFILDQLRTFLKGLYALGARRFAFAGLPPMGCLPLVMTTDLGDAFIRRCIDNLNMVAVSYNSKLQNMLNEMKEKELKDAKIAYADIYTATLDIIKHPNKYGFEVTNRGCCGTGFLELSFFCNHASPLCHDVSSYVFWDSIHPTQRTYSFIFNTSLELALPPLLMERSCSPFSLANVPLLFLLTLCQHHKLVSSFAVGNHRPVPAIFVFGDSTVDPGNNNYLPTPVKGNFPPYGFSFPDHIATGRLSDGKLATDFIASYLGIKELVPPYLDPTLDERELLTGVSFAFAGSGYDPLTADNIGVVSVLEQLDYMKECLARMEKLVGKAGAAKIMEDSIFTVSAGTNDFVITYHLLPFRKKTFTLEEYQQFILHQLQFFLKELYQLGARRIAFAGLPPLGCLPVVMTTDFGDAFIRRCIDSMNMAAASYNSKLRDMLNEMKEEELKDAKIAYLDIYTPTLDIVENPNKYDVFTLSELMEPHFPKCKKTNPPFRIVENRQKEPTAHANIGLGFWLRLYIRMMFIMDLNLIGSVI
ncbi:uncharacterized protein LOC116246825 [Nymphaea colorata]|nr:uncharacterized protein LOC116246825 [Nymphaea colorata]